MLTKTELEILTKPFPPDKIGVKIQSVSKNKDKALLVCYLQHTDVYARLEEVDPSWSCKTLHVERVQDQVTVAMEINLKGVIRENVGEGEDEKSAYSDALKRTAMLFGVGRYLYDQENAWVPYNESQDRYRSWTVDEFNRAIRNVKDRLPLGQDKPPAELNTDPLVDPKQQTKGKTAPEIKTPLKQAPGPSAWESFAETKLPTSITAPTPIHVNITQSERIALETEILCVTKALGKDMTWLDAQFTKSYQTTLAKASNAQLNKGIKALKEKLPQVQQ